MKKHLFVVGLVLPLLLAAADKEGEGWKEFTSKEGGFSVSLPGTPEEKKETVKTGQGDIDVAMFLVEQKKDEAAYIVVYSDFPEETVKNTTEEKRLDNARDGGVANAKGKLLSEKKITLDKNAGRELQIEVPKGVVRIRLFVVKERLYQVLVTGPKAVVTSKDADKFLDSFKLLAK